MYSSPVYRAAHPRREPVEDPPAAVRDQGEGEAGHRQQGLLDAGQSTPGPGSAGSYTGQKSGAS